MQQTIAREITITGVGLHSGANSTIILKPASENTGIIFKRTDIKNTDLIKGTYNNVVDTKNFSNDEIITSTSLRTKFIESIPFNLKENSFLLCHNSYIVNMNKIKGIKDLEFIMDNGDLVPISKRMLKEVKDEYINYLVGDNNEIR